MLKVKNVYKKYKTKEVLKGLSFNAKKGRIMAFLGNNGQGKTTTFRCILDLIKPDIGEISFDDKPIDKRKVGYLPEERVLYSDISVIDQVYFIGRLKQMRESQIDKRFNQLIELLNLVEYKYTKISKLSKGNQQKVQLMACIINNPDLIIMDEPWTGLDQDNIKIFENIILDLKNDGKCIIISSHQYQPILKICDDFVYLKNGVIKFQTSTEQLSSDPRKVMQLQVTDSFYLEDETIIKETNNRDYVRYILKNDKNLDKLVKECNHNNLVKRVEISNIQIDDLIGEENE